MTETSLTPKFSICENNYFADRPESEGREKKIPKNKNFEFSVFNPRIFGRKAGSTIFPKLHSENASNTLEENLEFLQLYFLLHMETSNILKESWYFSAENASSTLKESRLGISKSYEIGSCTFAGKPQAVLRKSNISCCFIYLCNFLLFRKAANTFTTHCFLRIIS